jgi:hypothetical protein
MTTAPYPSHRQSWERPSLVRLAAGASSDKFSQPAETTPAPGIRYGTGS